VDEPPLDRLIGSSSTRSPRVSLVALRTASVSSVRRRLSDSPRIHHDLLPIVFALPNHDRRSERLHASIVGPWRPIRIPRSSPTNRCGDRGSRLLDVDAAANAGGGGDVLQHAPELRRLFAFVHIRGRGRRASWSTVATTRAGVAPIRASRGFLFEHLEADGFLVGGGARLLELAQRLPFASPPSRRSASTVSCPRHRAAALLTL